ncbi:MAG: hypothetical protein BIFFINMI_04082 [Phycisphaerae bacterium]|nr:hypothetical protein [Phycisphaerae bacterium]
MSSGVYLEMTYQGGKPMVGYLYLPRRPGDHAERSRKVARGLVVDFAPDGRPIGIEIVSPSVVTRDSINRVLRELSREPLPDEELAPLGKE